MILKTVTRRQQKHEKLPSMQIVVTYHAQQDNIFCFKNSQDPDQLASYTDQHLHCFSTLLV